MPLRAYQPSPTSWLDRRKVGRNLTSLGASGPPEQERCSKPRGFVAPLTKCLPTGGDRQEFVDGPLGNAANQLVFVLGAAGRHPAHLQEEGETAKNGFVRVRRHGDVDFHLQAVPRVLGGD